MVVGVVGAPQKRALPGVAGVLQVLAHLVGLREHRPGPGRERIQGARLLGLA